MYKKACCTCRVAILLIKPLLFWRSCCRRRRSFVRSLFSDSSERRSFKTFCLWKTSYSIAWENRSVHRLGEWYAKIQFLLPKNGRESLKVVSKMGFNEWYSNYCFEYSIRKNRTTFTYGRCSCTFSAATQKGVLRLLSNRVFWLTTSIFWFCRSYPYPVV